jgi:hypothetical protein
VQQLALDAGGQQCYDLGTCTGHLSSMAEHSLRKREVLGSSPKGGSKQALRILAAGFLFIRWLLTEGPA